MNQNVFSKKVCAKMFVSKKGLHQNAITMKGHTKMLLVKKYAPKYC